MVRSAADAALNIEAARIVALASAILNFMMSSQRKLLLSSRLKTSYCITIVNGQKLPEAIFLIASRERGFQAAGRNAKKRRNGARKIR
jgi:hypothetical protein